MLFQFGLMAAEDGLVMQLHPASSATITRPHSHARCGHRHDVPALTRSQNRCASCSIGWHDASFQIVLFTVDETAFSRDIAPLAGFYPSVYAGAPWWFLDAAAVRRFAPR